jgi:hypothetical protein
MIASSSWSKNKPSMKQVTNLIFWVICYTLPGGFLHDIFFDVEGGGNMFLRNVGSFSTDYALLYLRNPRGENLISYIVKTENI